VETGFRSRSAQSNSLDSDPIHLNRITIQKLEKLAARHGAGRNHKSGRPSTADARAATVSGDGRAVALRDGVLGNPFGRLLLPEKVRSETIAARRQNRTDFDLGVVDPSGGGKADEASRI
jgi:hypothetical protein